MYFHSLSGAAARVLKALVTLVSTAICLLLVCCAPSNTSSSVLRVCADPNNLPFSNDRLEGFENKIAEVLAHELHRSVAYTWWAQRRGFFRNTLNAGMCDVVMGVPANFEMTLTTSPYYTSSYVFVSQHERGLNVHSLDDPSLRQLRIGVQLVGDDFTNTPPADILSRRGITQNVRGFTVYGDYSQPNPPARIIDAVADGSIDLAIVWGPLAGYFGRRQPMPLEIVPTPQTREDFLPLAYAISMGVRKGDTVLRNQLEKSMARTKEEIEEILTQYGVPRVVMASGIRSAKR